MAFFFPLGRPAPWRLPPQPFDCFLISSGLISSGLISAFTFILDKLLSDRSKSRRLCGRPHRATAQQTLKKARQLEYLAEGKNEIPELIFLSPGLIVWDEGKQVGRTQRNHVDMDNWRNRVFGKACDKAKIRRRRVHDTRHTFASLLLSNGEPLKYVSAQLGHASIRMTADVYGHLEVGSNRAAMDRLPSLNGVPQAAHA